MGLPKLWGKDSDGNHGFIFSHVKTIYYNWSQKKLLKDKLDEMDTLITENADAIAQRLVTNTALNTALANYVSKSMMSGTQVNDANKVPNSALAYAMAQTITQNATNIESLNGIIKYITKGSFTIEISNVHETRITVPGDFNNLDNYFVIIFPGGSEILDKTWSYYIRESNKSSFVAGFSISSPGSYLFKYIVIA